MKNRNPSRRSRRSSKSTGSSGVAYKESPRKVRRSQRARRSSIRSSRAYRRFTLRRGLAAIDYCFLLSIILLVVLLAVQHVGSALKDSMNYSASKVQALGL